mmetsp:Transcript_124831/g.216385  ORF Transcript_124831/g.216385 Transcript_124831/m.216385 type:complete len:317 (-) Transcript_124831:242-1192(-)
MQVVPLSWASCMLQPIQCILFDVLGLCTPLAHHQHLIIGLFVLLCSHRSGDGAQEPSALRAGADKQLHPVQFVPAILTPFAGALEPVVLPQLPQPPAGVVAWDDVAVAQFLPLTDGADSLHEQCPAVPPLEHVWAAAVVQEAAGGGDGVGEHPLIPRLQPLSGRVSLRLGIPDGEGVPLLFSHIVHDRLQTELLRAGAGRRQAGGHDAPDLLQVIPALQLPQVRIAAMECSEAVGKGSIMAGDGDDADQEPGQTVRVTRTIKPPLMQDAVQLLKCLALVGVPLVASGAKALLGAVGHTTALGTRQRQRVQNAFGPE